MPSILFICTANQLRSPIAAATFRAATAASGQAADWQVDSAGTWTRAGLPILPYALQLARKLGLDLSGHRTTRVEDVRLEGYDWLVVMEQNHRESLGIEFPALKSKIYLLTELAGGLPSDIPDPVEVDPETALRILQELQQLVRQIAVKLLAAEDAPQSGSPA